MSVRTYRDLIAWQKAMELAAAVYRESRKFPADERYGLTSQLRRAAVSIPSNIAEGQGRQSTGEFRQFLGNARGSLLEVETQVLLGEKLGYLPRSVASQLTASTEELGRILNGLMNSLGDGSHRAATA